MDAYLLGCLVFWVSAGGLILVCLALYSRQFMEFYFDLMEVKPSGPHVAGSTGFVQILLLPFFLIALAAEGLKRMARWLCDRARN